MYIYLLKLKSNKYYVGRTSNPKFRLDDHFCSNGSEWTKKYIPIDVIKVIPDCENEDEDKYTLKLMNEHGINNVRGGSFCKILLSDENILTLQQMLNNVNNKCYICGALDHFASDCKPNVNNVVDGPCDCPTSYFSRHRKSKCLLNNSVKFISSLFEDENSIVDKLKPRDKKTDDNCFKCGRKGHWAKNCYALYHVNGNLLRKGSCYKCGKYGHWSRDCSEQINNSYK